MMYSDTNLAELVLKGIADIEKAVNAPNPELDAKDREIAELDRQLEEMLQNSVIIENKLNSLIVAWKNKIFLFEQTPEKLQEILEREQKEADRLAEMVREKEAENRRLKALKESNRKRYAREKKERQEKIKKLK